MLVTNILSPCPFMHVHLMESFSEGLNDLLHCTIVTSIYLSICLLGMDVRLGHYIPVLFFQFLGDI